MGPLVAPESLPRGEHAVAVGALARLLLCIRIHVLVPVPVTVLRQWRQRWLGLQGRSRSWGRGRGHGRRAAAAPAAAHVAGAVAAERLVGAEHLLARDAHELRPLLHRWRRRRRGPREWWRGGRRVAVVTPVVGAVVLGEHGRRPGVAGEHHEG